MPGPMQAHRLHQYAITAHPPVVHADHGHLLALALSFIQLPCIAVRSHHVANHVSRPEGHAPGRTCVVCGSAHMKVVLVVSPAAYMQAHLCSLSFIVVP